MFRFLFLIIKVVLGVAVLSLISFSIWWVSDANSFNAFYTKHLSSYYEAAAKKIDGSFYQKKVLVTGLRTLSSEQIKVLLPMDRNNLYWNLNKASIEQKLKLLPMVHDASVVPCDENFPPTCFTVDITEKIPAYIAVHGNTAILLDNEGLELNRVAQSALAEALSQVVDPNFQRPKVLVGLYPEESSIEQMRARFNYINDAIKLIEKESGIQFSRVELLSSGELSLKPLRANFLVQFDNNWQDPQAFREEVTRLKLTLAEIADRLSEVTKVDLAYDRLVVVSYKEEPQKPVKKK